MLSVRGLGWEDVRASVHMCVCAVFVYFHCVSAAEGTL